MTWLLLPLQTRRTDAAAGAVSRQLPHWMADVVRPRGVSARLHALQAHRGGQVAQVLLESPLPWPAVQAAAREVGARGALVGEVIHQATGWHVALAVVSTEEGQVLAQANAGPGPLVQSAPQALQALIDVLGLPGGPVQAPAATEEAWQAWMLDADHEVWLEALDPAARAQVPHRHRVDTLLRALPDPLLAPLATRALLQRCAGWLDSAPREAARALALAVQIHPQDEALLRDALVAAEASGDEAEHWMRQLLRATPAPHPVALRLGVHLLRLQRAAEALPLLQSAREGSPTRDAADTYLGIALAALDRVPEAIECWHRIARDCTDPHLRRIALENLARVGSA
jgi:hypothetical protein